MPLTLDRAKETPLMGLAASWDCHGGRKLSDVPDKVLRQARRWFAQKCRDDPHGASTFSMQIQVECIDLVLTDRAAHSPQHSLTL